MEYCLADARVQGKSGVCLLGAKKQKAWLTDQAFARKFGFEVVDATDDGYELLALSFDGTVPRFAPHAKAQAIDSDELTIYYDFQCPYVPERIEAIRRYCEANDVPLTLIQVDSLQKAAWLTTGATAGSLRRERSGYHVPQEDPQEIGALQTRQLTVSCASSSPFPLRRPSLSSYGSPRLAPSASRKPSIPNRESIARSSWCSTCLPMR